MTGGEQYEFLLRKLGSPTIAAVMLAAVAVGGVAGASIPDSAGIIHACYQKTSPHTLFVVNAPAHTCATGQNPLSLSQSPEVLLSTPAGSPPPRQVIAVLPGGFTVRLNCQGQIGQVQEWVDVASASIGDVGWSYQEGGSSAQGSTPLAAGQFVEINYKGQSITGLFVFHSGSVVTTLTYNVATDSGTGSCQLTGVATAGA